MKLAVIFEGCPFDRKGLFNAVHERVKHLSRSCDFDIDVYCLHSRDNAFTRRVRRLPQVPFKEKVEIENITYNMIWYKFSIIDEILTQKLYRSPCFYSRFIDKIATLFKRYDCISAHSYEGAVLAHKIWQEYKIPYYVSWHGSDIHTRPWKNPYLMKQTKMLLDDATMNFYVSDSLSRLGNKIAPTAPCQVLYNGVNQHFYKYTDATRKELRTTMGIPNESKVIAYVGNFQKVKNALSLPEIFCNIFSYSSSPIEFWIIGDGKLRRPLLKSMCLAAKKHKISLKSPWKAEEYFSSARGKIVFWGNVSVGKMPDMMNCIDVLVVPSFNEGSSLVCAEAIKSGAAVVGSDVCGIPDIIGKDYVVPLNENFAHAIAIKAIKLLTEEPSQRLSAQYDWDKTAQQEEAFLKRLNLNKKY